VARTLRQHHPVAAQLAIQARNPFQVDLEQLRCRHLTVGQHPRLRGRAGEGEIASIHRRSVSPCPGGQYRDVMSCVFCAIVAGDAPAIRVYEDADYLAILDIRPFTRGHTLVIPKRHTVDLTDTPPETLAAMATIGQRIARAARATELADATNIGINDGRAAFQSVFHIHLHVLPRRNGDKLSVARGMLLRRDPDREATARILRDALARIDARQ
jgi:histidine triad (HIT) family protein